VLIVNTTKMTARQFLELGEDPPGVRLELVDGEVAVSPSPVPDHSHVVLNLSAILLQHVKAKRLGRVYSDVDTLVSSHDVRRPDILFFSTEKLKLVGKKAMEGPPDLCVEVISPSSATIDRVDKYEQYQSFGVGHYWIVDPDHRTIEAHRLVGGVYQPAGNGRDSDVVRLPPFEDLETPLGEIWPPES